MAREFKTHEIRQAHAKLDAIEALHVSSQQNGPSRVDHGPYVGFHDSDNPEECPVCETLMHVKALRAWLNGEKEQ